eukprot:1161780-Pelagomonas_calceolata.AAC.6
MPTTDILKTLGLRHNPFTDRTAEKTEIDPLCVPDEPIISMHVYFPNTFLKQKQASKHTEQGLYVIVQQAPLTGTVTSQPGCSQDKDISDTQLPSFPSRYNACSHVPSLSLCVVACNICILRHNLISSSQSTLGLVGPADG